LNPSKEEGNMLNKRSFCFKILVSIFLLVWVFPWSGGSIFGQNAVFENIKFLGGTADLKPKSKVTMTFDDTSSSIVLKKGEKQASCSYKSVTRITYGKNVRRRVAETVIGRVEGTVIGRTPIGALGAPPLLPKQEEYQILIEYKDGDNAGAWVVEVDKNRLLALLGTLRAKTGVEPTTEVGDSGDKKDQ
jgi:hypothetical protein